MQLREDALKALMLRSLDGDAGAYRQLLGALSEQLRRYFALRLDGEPEIIDGLVVDALSAAHRRKATYRRRDPFTPWMYAIARYKLIQYRRPMAACLPAEDYASFMAA